MEDLEFLDVEMTTTESRTCSVAIVQTHWFHGFEFEQRQCAHALGRLGVGSPVFAISRWV